MSDLFGPKDRHYRLADGRVELQFLAKEKLVILVITGLASVTSDAFSDLEDHFNDLGYELQVILL